MKIPLLAFVLALGSLSITIADDAAPALKEGREVAYATFGDRSVTLDWFRPDNKAVYPGIVLIHGGGWTGGSRTGFEETAKRIARNGYVVSNIDYRLATEAKFPGAVLDCKAAVRWMRANAEKLGVNPEKIGAVGGSAGGHLVAMIATTSGDERFSDSVNSPGVSDELQAAIILGAGVDQVARVKATKGGSIKNCVIFFGGEYTEVPEVYAMGSPITHLSEKTPPILMMDGEFDTPGERYGEFRGKLDGFGVRNEFLMIPGAKHGQWVKEPFLASYIKAYTTFLDSVLK
jgi:acetyl esterase/lipase